MRTPKSKRKANSPIYELSDWDIVSEGRWHIHPDAPGSDKWVVWAYGPLPYEAGVESRKVRVAVCDSRELARELVGNRQISEAATNWIGLIFRVITKALMGEEAQKYRDAWRRAGVPLDSEEYIDRALDYSPLHPPAPEEYR